MPALFKRKSQDKADDTEEVGSAPSAVEDSSAKRSQVRDKTAPTPKRQVPKKKRPPKNPPMTAKEQRERAKQNAPSKDEKRAAVADRRNERHRIADGQERGDPLYDKYHMPRDKGPERLVVRDLVDTRRNVGQYFFLIALVIMFGSSTQMPYVVQQVALIGWVVILVAFAVDCVLLSRKLLRTVNKRFPKTTQKKAGLCWYAISRSIMFRKLRMPRPRPGMTPGTPQEELGKVIRT